MNAIKSDLREYAISCLFKFEIAKYREKQDQVKTPLCEDDGHYFSLIDRSKAVATMKKCQNFLHVAIGVGQEMAETCSWYENCIYLICKI